MGKVIWRGFRNADEVISTPVSIITGANLKKREKSSKQTKEPKKEKPK